MTTETVSTESRSGRAYDGTDATFGRLAGLGGIGFVIIVIVQNVIRGSAPSADADSVDIIRYFVEERSTLRIVTVLFAVNVPCLVLFASGVHRRIVNEGRPNGWATTGIIGTAMLASLFSVVVLTEVVGAALGTKLTDDTATLLWTINSAAFGLNMAAIAVALLGLGIGAGEAGLVPKWFRIAAPLAAICGIISAANAVTIAEGTEAAAAPGLIVFVVWLAFLLTAGFGLIKNR